MTKRQQLKAKKEQAKNEALQHINNTLTTPGRCWREMISSGGGIAAPGAFKK